MPSLKPLPADQLYRICDCAQLPFKTTDDLPDLEETPCQERAMDAIRFGATIRHDGYNIYALGPSGLGKRSAVRNILEKRAAGQPNPGDWCYVQNFVQPHKPNMLEMPPGRGTELAAEMDQLIDYLRSAIPKLFESDEYRDKIDAVQEEFEHRRETAFNELGEEARKQDCVLLRTPGGFTFAPTRFNDVLSPEDYEKLPESEKAHIKEKLEGLQEKLEKILRHLPHWHKEHSERIKKLNRETILSAVEHAMNELRTKFADLPQVQSYLDVVQQDVIEHADDFRQQEETASVDGVVFTVRDNFHRYQVNVLVSHQANAGAPLVSEDNPTYSNLLGRIEHVSHLGTLTTDFTLIKPGALHLANGGYLLVDAQKILSLPFAWEGLKRALKARKIHIESLEHQYSLVSTVSLEPVPIPLDAKVVLFGDRILYYLLQEFDPEFSELFKIAADFEERVERSPENVESHARLVATIARHDGLLPFDRGGVARVLEHCAREAGDAERLSTHIGKLKDLLREADHLAREAGISIVRAEDVQRAIDMQVRRQDRARSRIREEILRGDLMISSDGETTGQVNGLAVIDLGGFIFAQPTRITATTRLGAGDVVDIEREVKLSGATHSKGVLILSSYLSSHYARNRPLALSASLVFEQSYGVIDGDSASLAELCALLSHLANLPVRQGLAVTGSVNQRGEVQAIGAVNEKIEGFFDICAARGLNGNQGVLIPAANVKHLMLRHDVVEAARAGNFSIHAVTNVDEAMSLLTGLPAGEAGDGIFPDGSVNRRIATRLAELTRLRETFSMRNERRHGRRNAEAS